MACIGREQALRCLGWYCLLDGLPATPPVGVLCAALEADDPSNRAVAAQALCDVALLRCDTGRQLSLMVESCQVLILIIAASEW